MNYESEYSGASADGMLLQRMLPMRKSRRNGLIISGQSYAQHRALSIR